MKFRSPITGAIPEVEVQQWKARSCVLLSDFNNCATIISMIWGHNHTLGVSCIPIFFRIYGLLVKRTCIYLVRGVGVNI